MKGSNICVVAFIIFALLVLPVAMSTRKIAGHHSRLRASIATEKTRRGKSVKGLEPVKVAGSSLPDCSHACGSCSPCRLVMVSFVCASLAEAETCPMAYKCMCRHKSFPVP